MRITATTHRWSTLVPFAVPPHVQSLAYLHSQQVRNGPHPLRRNGYWLGTAGLDTALDTITPCRPPRPLWGTSGAEYKRKDLVNLCQNLWTPPYAPRRPLQGAGGVLTPAGSWRGVRDASRPLSTASAHSQRMELEFHNNRKN